MACDGPGRRSWLACGVLLDPADPASPQKLAELVGLGATGLRIQPPVTGTALDDPAVEGLWRAAAAAGIPVDVNLAQADYKRQVAEVARCARSCWLRHDVHIGSASPRHSTQDAANAKRAGLVVPHPLASAGSTLMC